MKQLLVFHCTDSAALEAAIGVTPPSVYNVACKGTEPSLVHCTFRLDGTCATNRLAAVQCGGQS